MLEETSYLAGCKCARRNFEDEGEYARGVHNFRGAVARVRLALILASIERDEKLSGE